MPEHLIHHHDAWGEIIERPILVEIRWFDTTRGMEGSDFNQFLSTFAGVVERSKKTRCLVDSTNFHMDFGKMSMGWRDEHIIPRYNAAGVERFAFHMPAGMPAIGRSPEKEGPASFPTAYFGTRKEAEAWLAALESASS